MAAAGGDAAWQATLVDSAVAYYDWLDRARDPDQDGLIVTFLPDESGLDHSPKYDAYLGLAGAEPRLADFDAAWRRVAAAQAASRSRPGGPFAADVFVVADVLVNSIYAENQRVLAGLCRRLGRDAEAERFAARAERSLEALLSQCWDQDRGLFFDLAGDARAHLRTDTVSSLFPILLPGLPAPVAERLQAHLASPAYASDFPVPSVAMTEAAFAPGVVGERLLWRGAVWINANWYLVRGLRRHGADELAGRIAQGSLELVRRSGFREYYDPFTGTGYGAGDFAWSALVLDLA